MAEILWHPHSGRNPRNVSKTRFSPNKDASKTQHKGGTTTSPHRRRRPKTSKQKTDADNQPSQQSNSHISFPHWPRPPPLAVAQGQPSYPHPVTTTIENPVHHQESVARSMSQHLTVQSRNDAPITQTDPKTGQIGGQNRLNATRILA